MTSMTQEQFQDALNARVSTIEKVLVSALPKNITKQKTIADAMEYSLMAGGKRLRPMLMLEAYRLFGGSDEAEIEPFMAAIEMIHTYSLVHDDLPAMDNDDYRRGRLTNHKVFGEAIAISAGDGLLNLAYETIFEALLTDPGARQTPGGKNDCPSSRGSRHGSRTDGGHAGRASRRQRQNIWILLKRIRQDS